jgi:hypothetical protein
VHLDKLGKWSDEEARRAFEQLDKMRVYAPGTLIENLEFHEQVEAALTLLDTSAKPRELLLEAWLLVDFVATYLLRDALGLPVCVENDLKLLPFQFERKLDLISRLHRRESKLLPNQKSYVAYELHPEFYRLLSEDKELHDRFLQLAISFESDRCPKEALAIVRNDFEKSRFVPEWWYNLVSTFDDEWFAACRRLNKARNIAAHKFKMTEVEIFNSFDVENLADFKRVLNGTIKRLLFKPGT